MTNTLLYAVIITSIMALIKQYSFWGTLIFGVVSILALALDRIVENRHLKEEEKKKRR